EEDEEMEAEGEKVGEEENEDENPVEEQEGEDDSSIEEMSDAGLEETAYEIGMETDEENADIDAVDSEQTRNGVQKSASLSTNFVIIAIVLAALGCSIVLIFLLPALRGLVFPPPPPCTMEYYAKNGAHFGDPCTPQRIRPGREGLEEWIRGGRITLISEQPHFFYRWESSGMIYRFHENDDMDQIKIVKIAIKARKEQLKKDEESRAIKKKDKEIREKFEAEKRIREEKQKKKEKQQLEEKEKKRRNEHLRINTGAKATNLAVPPSMIPKLLLAYIILMIGIALCWMVQFCVRPRFPKNQTPIRTVVLKKSENGWGIVLRRNVIVKLIADGAAAIQGKLLVGDVIVGVDDVNVETLHHSKIAELIRNKTNSVRLWVINAEHQ
ncbi:hypothetical protein PENTCL1PPCAC_10287, partial [Pristionchus entomophagus]